MKKIKNLRNKLLLTAAYICLVLIAYRLSIPCVYRYFLGIPCPGCGMSRAYFSLLRLDFAAAFSFHPMFWSVPILYLYFLFDGHVFSNKFLNYGIPSVLGAGFLVNWLFRLF